jgi:hypothetical protein
MNLGRNTRRHARKARTTASFTLAECLLGVLIVAAQVGSAQAYLCTSDADCQYPTCNDISCACSYYQSTQHWACVNGFWTGFAGCRNGVWDAKCIYGGCRRACLSTAYGGILMTWDGPCNYDYGGDGICSEPRCDAGKYSKPTGSSTCVDCERGKYSVTVGAISEATCTPCSNRTKMFSSAGSSSSTACSINWTVSYGGCIFRGNVNGAPLVREGSCPTATGTLVLSALGITEVPAPYIYMYKHIMHTYYDKHIMQVPGNAFQGMNMMEGLLLDNNNLQVLPEAIFTGLSNVSTIDVSYNKLGVMPVGLLRGLTSLTSFQMQGNPGPVPQQLPSTCVVG